MKKIFIYLIFFILFNNVSFAFFGFGKLKVVCLDKAGEVGGIEVIEKSDYIQFNSITLPITKNNEDELVAQDTINGNYYFISIRKKSLLFLYNSTLRGIPGAIVSSGRCQKL